MNFHILPCITVNPMALKSKLCLKYAVNLHIKNNHLAPKYMPAENSNKQHETIIFVCALNFPSIFWLIANRFFLTLIFSYVKSYWWKKSNSPRVSHFSLALQISSLERKDLKSLQHIKEYFLSISLLLY